MLFGLCAFAARIGSIDIRADNNFADIKFEQIPNTDCNLLCLSNQNSELVAAKSVFIVESLFNLHQLGCDLELA